MKREMICHCGEHYMAREADLKRGWAKSCSKSCAAIRRDFGRPSAKPVDGSKLPRVKKKGARRLTPDTRTYTVNDVYECEDHPFSSEALGQW